VFDDVSSVSDFFSHFHPSTALLHFNHSHDCSSIPLIAPPLGIVHAPRPSFWGFRSVARVTFSGWLSMRQTITRLTPLSRHLHNKLATARCIYINVYTSIHIHKYIILAKHVKCITHNNIWFSYPELTNIYIILCVCIYIIYIYTYYIQMIMNIIIAYNKLIP